MSQSGPAGLLVQGAVFDAPGANPAGVRLRIGASVRQTTVVTPVFANGFATEVIDEGVETTFLPTRHDASLWQLIKLIVT